MKLSARHQRAGTNVAMTSGAGNGTVKVDSRGGNVSAEADAIAALG